MGRSVLKSVRVEFVGFGELFVYVWGCDLFLMLVNVVLVIDLLRDCMFGVRGVLMEDIWRV